MADVNDPLMAMSQTIGKLEGTVSQGFEDVKRRMSDLEQAFRTQPAVLADHERRLSDLEQYRKTQRADQRFFWGGVVAMLAAAATAAKLLLGIR